MRAKTRGYRATCLVWRVLRRTTSETDRRASPSGTCLRPSANAGHRQTQPLIPSRIPLSSTFVTGTMVGKQCSLCCAASVVALRVGYAVLHCFVGVASCSRNVARGTHATKAAAKEKEASGVCLSLAVRAGAAKFWCFSTQSSKEREVNIARLL